MRTARWRSQTIAEIQLKPHGNASSTWPVTILPPEKLRDKSSPWTPGMENCWSSPVLEVWGWDNSKCEVPVISRAFHEAAERRRLLRGFNGKRANLLECGWRRITYQNLSLYLKLCFKISNECMYDAYYNGLFFLQKKQIISSAKFNKSLLLSKGCAPQKGTWGRSRARGWGILRNSATTTTRKPKNYKCPGYEGLNGVNR